MTAWRRIDKGAEMPDEARCLNEPEKRLRYFFLGDKYGNPNIGTSAREWYDNDSIYWHPRLTIP